jgi:hypothetical protein
VLALVERGGNHACLEADLVAQAKPGRAVLGVVTQLFARSVHARPRAPLGERELVAKRRDVHGHAGIAVPVPGAAEAVAIVDDQVVRHAGAIEIDPDPDPGEPGADDERVELCARRPVDAHPLRLAVGYMVK